ncbi:MAG: hypothetical protein WC749_15155 [Dehalococcoidia bacterium]
MTDGTKDRRYMVIQLNIRKDEKDARSQCVKIISEQLALAKTDGWHPCIPTDFDYLERNGYVRVRHKEKIGETMGVNALLFLLSSALVSVAVSASDGIYDSVTIPLCREQDH